jgi:hypothetical protein
VNANAASTLARLLAVPLLLSAVMVGAWAIGESPAARVRGRCLRRGGLLAAIEPGSWLTAPNRSKPKATVPIRYVQPE